MRNPAIKNIISTTSRNVQKPHSNAFHLVFCIELGDISGTGCPSGCVEVSGHRGQCWGAGLPRGHGGGVRRHPVPHRLAEAHPGT